MENAIQVKSLSKKYGNFLALDRVNLSVQSGSFFALLGPNGAGKTTLMRLLTTQLEPSGGEAFVFGKNIVTQGEAVRETVSYVPQEMSVWTDISGYENLLIYSKIYGLPAEEREKAIADSLKLMELGDVAHKLVSTYSGGMIRKLEIASATMLKPKIIFLDEPTIGLDPASRKTVWTKIRSLSRDMGTTVFFSTHYMDEADFYADEIGIINHGRLVKTGRPADLKSIVGRNVLEVELGSDPGKQDLAGAGAVQGVESVSAAGRDMKMKLGNNGALKRTLGFLATSAMDIKGVSTSRPGLDDVFLKYVGSDESAKGVEMADLKGTRKRIKGP